MKNRTRKNSPDFGLQPPNRGNHPGNAFRRFCNGILAICNGIAKRNQNGGIANAKFGVRAEPFNGGSPRAYNGIMKCDGDSDIAKQSRKGQSPFNGRGTAAAHTARASANFEAQVARIVGEELRRAVMPLLAEIDAIAALLKETAAEAGAFKPVEMDASDMPISTRCGRTSVVVGRRKIS